MQGTFRQCRHESRIESDGSEPVPMPGLSAEAIWFWEWTVPGLQRLGIVSGADSATLSMMCEAWAAWRIELAAYHAGEGKITSLTNAQAAFDKLASRFGMTPSDRTKIRAEGPKEGSEFMDLITKSG